MGQVKTNYSTGTPLLQQGDVVYLVDLSPCGTLVQHHAINMFTKELSTYGCRTNGEFLFRKVSSTGNVKNYRGGFYRLAIAVSVICFSLCLGILGIGLSSEGVKNLNFQNILGIIGIFILTVTIPMGIFHGVDWIVKGFKSK